MGWKMLDREGSSSMRAGRRSPLQQVSRLSNSTLFERYIGEVRKRLSCSRFQHRQTR
jgi:hypothetical protein